MAIEPLPSRRDDADQRPPRRVAVDVDRLLAGFGAPPAPVMATLAERWSEIVGPVMVDHSRPGGLIDETLRIDVESSTWAAQLRWSSDEVLTRCTDVIGPGRVTAIDVRVRTR